MTGWLAANLAQRAARDVMNEAKRFDAGREICPACGGVECDSALCETKRRKAEQQAKAQVQAARAGYSSVEVTA